MFFFICLLSPTLLSLTRFKDYTRTSFPSSLQDSDTARQYFLKLLVQQIEDSVVFEGPDGSKNLALDSQGISQYSIFLPFNFSSASVSFPVLMTHFL